MSAATATGAPLPRLCCLEKGPNGYGFHLHGEKGKVGQFIRLVEPGSPAEKAGLLAGDRLVEVNGENVEKETHQQVVNRIRSALNSVRLLVVDPDTDEQLQKLGVPVREELLRAPERSGPAEAAAATEAPGDGGESEPREAEKSQTEQQHELRPRLCAMKKGPSGYGFNLHSDKSKPGQFIRAVDPDSPAEASGLRAQDRIVEVNGICMEDKQHGDVVSAIKAGGDETKLLVVDRETDEFFKKCRVTPSQEHLDGPLPEPFTNGELQKENSQEVVVGAASESPKPTLARSTSSDTSEELNSQDIPRKQDSTAPSSASSSSDPMLDFNISLAVAKERARQKRSSKQAPQMDWSKKNELFSNL
ncbi:PREDICTED: Na(+)/H(+) exchange regulatory cofactor NHE-RF1 [Chrysochloris asiatica]|uniref:Na(+)/H(+) exchange regulatory cofactor NHE-RF n=1 Tax=Chrysochloris asiatica TaxID=185453 RepID=A0A9B0TQN7_CHRAS|nr:PREDICTED: Na(+)/H(+) exchange regulatory cofactor NHE-RF1 [Chrysochloris asiatica]